MATLAPSAPRRAIALGSTGWAAILLLAVALLIRLPAFGNPAIEIDEEFYLLVGDRLLHGAIPFVDIWDRKPIGLFLIYAFAQALGGNGIVQYQLLATLSAAGTALCLFLLARRFAGVGGAIAGGILYLLWIETVEGGGGQSPIFYNLPMAGAAVRLAMPDDGRARRGAFAAMLLVGIALQIKYTVVFEGFLFGLIAAWRAWCRDHKTAPLETALLALTALGPTLAAIAFYAAIGHLPEFWYANFTSVFQRGATPGSELLHRTWSSSFHLIPLAVCAVAAAWHLLRSDRAIEARLWLIFMASWCVAALIGYFALGVLSVHYLLPVFVPFAAASAPLARRWPTGPVLLGLAAWIPASNLGWPDFATTARSQQDIAALRALIPADVTSGCMHMFDGPPILYHLTHSCMVSRYVFPDHLSAANEVRSIGEDPAIETRRVLAAKPLVITIGETDLRPPNAQTYAIMRAGLARSYRLAGRAWVDARFIQVYVRR